MGEMSFLAVSKSRLLQKKPELGCNSVIKKRCVMSSDWLPGSRTGQLNMAKVWTGVISAKKSLWSFPDSLLADLLVLVEDAQAAFYPINSPDRTNVITAECNRVFGLLVVKMRFTKDHYFKSPPLVDEDYTSLLLNTPVVTRTPCGVPRAQVTAEIRCSGTDMLILVYRYAEGTEHLAGPHTDISRQVRWGLLPPDGVTPLDIELTKIPADPLELPNVIDTHRMTDIINFPVGSSGKTAFFSVRLCNGKQGYGPWCPIFHAVVP